MHQAEFLFLDCTGCYTCLLAPLIQKQKLQFGLAPLSFYTTPSSGVSIFSVSATYWGQSPSLIYRVAKSSSLYLLIQWICPSCLGWCISKPPQSRQSCTLSLPALPYCKLLNITRGSSDSAFSWYLTPFSLLLPVFLFLLHAGLIAFLEEVVRIHTPCPIGVLLSWCESAGP